MTPQLRIILLAIAIYGVGLLIYFYWQTTRDRFYENREERRRKRTFKSAGQFVRKSSGSSDQDDGTPPNSDD